MKNVVDLWRVLLGAIMLLTVFADIERANASETEGEKIGITVDFTYASKYLWHGYDVFGDNGSYQPMVLFDVKGLFWGMWGAGSLGSGYEDWNELDFFAGYNYAFFKEERYIVASKIDYWYVSHPKGNFDRDVQQISGAFSMPKILPLGSSFLVPSYAIFHISDGLQSRNTIKNGWFQTLGLSYDFPIPPMLSEQNEQAIKVSWDLSFNDGVFGCDPGLSHSSLNVSTTYLWRKMYFTPALHYQWSFEDTINPEDEFYVTLSLGYRF